jgi:lysophospholipase-3
VRVKLHDQTAACDCPRNGSFEDWFPNDQHSPDFSQVCRDKLMTLRFGARSSQPMAERFAEQVGVSVDLVDYGTTQSAPFYEPMYQRLEAAGYVRNQDIRVAGYDARLTPDLGDFLERTRQLVEDAYRQNGSRPVHLIGHSNGPLYAHYLLTHSSPAWRAQFIHGFSPIAGNFPGQGGIYALVFTGLNITDFSSPTTVENAESSARMYLSAPSTYMSGADPRIFGDQIVVVGDASTGRTYTPTEVGQLYADAGLTEAAELASYYVGFVEFADRAHFPGVDVFAEKGSGTPTVVGTELPNLSVGQVLDASTPVFTRDGDGNQEDVTNDAISAWSAMDCYHFSVTDNPAVDHFALPNAPAVLDHLVAAAARPRTNCG